ncbi:hypothetical protein ELS24_20745 [Achromobacter spanius]|uniref:hypothetical protein n=1 Tax=Achromobacter spanius TaxID=217203 RepID=UPI000F8FB25E|nr:hypothetical protein [Achromobacter spanius]AZS80662.1 hypothetical protein ELS24_20745 [Achromobacter spanius]
MDLKTVLDIAIAPALALLPADRDTREARVMLLAIGLQESRFVHRRQINGPAVGFWQFERGGGVRGVLAHASSWADARSVCAVRDVEPTATDVYNSLAHDDILAAAFARLLLWTDPLRLPSLGDANGGWALYLRTWRPGKPHPETWAALYAQAMATVGGGNVGMA